MKLKWIIPTWYVINLSMIESSSNFIKIKAMFMVIVVLIVFIDHHIQMTRHNFNSKFPHFYAIFCNFFTTFWSCLKIILEWCVNMLQNLNWPNNLLKAHAPLLWIFQHALANKTIPTPPLLLILGHKHKLLKQCPHHHLDRFDPKSLSFMA